MIEDVQQSLDMLGKVVELLGNMVGLIISVVGVCFVEGMRSRQRTALFGFWSQLRIRLSIMMSSLKKRPSLLNNLYSPRIRETFEEGSPSTDEVERFKRTVIETETFLKKASDQMPAYKGWSDDLAVVTGFMADVIIYGIDNPKECFVDDGFPDRDAYCDTVCASLSNIIDQIDGRQKAVEDKIEGSRWSRLWWSF